MNQKTKPQTGTTNWQQFGKYRSRILHRENLAKNVNLYVLEKPHGFNFAPGQAIDMAIDELQWCDDRHPFTITSLPDNPRLELIIKSYPVDSNPDHDGMTEHLGRDIKVGDRVIFGNAWGAIEYRGKGIFIAGGAGMTPFVSILRKLEQDGQVEGHRLFASHRTADDVFLQGEFVRMLGRNAVFTLTEEDHRDYENSRIDKGWLKSRVNNFSQYFYICGPPPMVEEVAEILKDLGVDKNRIVIEES